MIWINSVLTGQDKASGLRSLMDSFGEELKAKVESKMMRDPSTITSDQQSKVDALIASRAAGGGQGGEDKSINVGEMNLNVTPTGDFNAEDIFNQVEEAARRSI